MSESGAPRVLDDAVWEEVVEATRGMAAPCFQCGVCTAVCPWGLVQAEPVSVRRLVRLAQLGVERWGEAIWRCTTCGACEALCPRGVPVSEVLLALRQLAWKRRSVPKGLSTMLWAVHWDGNPWDQPPSARTAWSRGLDVPAFTGEQEILLYVGCTATYDRRSQKVARSLARLLGASGVSFGVLPDEPCCGEAVRVVGQEGYLAEVVEATSRRFRDAGVRRLVALSPHCFDMFRTRYPFDGEIEVLHSTELLARLVDEGRLGFAKNVAATVTYHDPCYLGRRHGLYDPPRRLLAAIPGVTVVEMSSSREDALCCGGGGGRMWLETEAGERFGDLRVRQAEEAGAEVLATSCPFCVLCLEDSAKGLDGRLRVLDLSELACQALGEGRGDS
ncbi:MAG: (Fe-S)-binding protein [Candidatus Rokubacteria bacterium]|nr:(Fe-S)-binding protein [Candidatus Rokubacteria bacterium]MBI2879523.1 (Fe-S)-binding protein [Candidatus Rokubacteria bacterium]